MNYEINKYEIKQDFFKSEKRCYEDNIDDYEKEYELQNNSRKYNNIDSFLSPGYRPKELNYNSNYQNSLSAMSEQKNTNKLYSNSFICNGKLNNYDNNNYINENNSITLLTLTDKIYEDEDHFQKGIIRKKNSKLDNSSRKDKLFSKGAGNNNKRSNRKSLFISNNKELNREFSKKEISAKRKRASVVMENRNKSNLDLFDKFKQRKNSVILDKENEKSNNYTNIDEKINRIYKEKTTIEENNKKSKFKKLYSKQIEDEYYSKSLKSCQFNFLKNRNKTVKNIKTNKKNKLSLGENENKEKEEKTTSKKDNNIKANDKKKNDSKKASNKSNNIKIHKNKKINEEKNFITCLFCCLNS